MQVYDKVIETTRELLKPFPVKELNRNHAKPWNLLKENESSGDQKECSVYQDHVDPD